MNREIKMMFSVILPVFILVPMMTVAQKLEMSKFKTPINTADYQLSLDLLKNYPAGYNVMPVANPHDQLNVSLQLALYHIVDMNERAQTLTTNCEVITKWHDVFLMWDPSEYDNITDTRLPWDKVWTPDIVLYNSAGDGEQGREMRTLIQVTYDGNVTLLTQSIYMSKCTIDVSFYPFDAQKCELKFASWSTEVTRLNITIGDIDKRKILGLYSPSGVFELKKFFAVRHELPDPCCVDAFADVTYYLVIWRRPKFFLFNYIQPAVLINILALFVFMIPAESGEKITLGISTMLNMTVFLMTVMSGLPATDQTPILSIYYAITMVLTTAATVLGVIVLRIHHQGRRGIPVPPYLRLIAKVMACLSYSSYPDVEKQLDNLSKGFTRPTGKDDYCYNIKEYDNLDKKKSQSPFFRRQWMTRKNDEEMQKTAEDPVTQNLLRNGQPGSAPKWRSRNQTTIVNNSPESQQTTSTCLLESNFSDEESGRGESTNSPLVKDKARNLWKKAAAQTPPLSPTMEQKPPKKELSSKWTDLTNIVMEDRYKEDQRKEIIGEEWRKIARICDRFLFILFVILSLINTVWCIFTSPHFPASESEDDDVANYQLKSTDE